MTDRPILVQGDMVRAIRDGRKTQARRVISLDMATLPNSEARVSGDGILQFRCPPENMIWRDICRGNMRGPKSRHCKPIKCPYGVPGDLLWVRETWLRTSRQQDHPPTGKVILYRADEDNMELDVGRNWYYSDYDLKWRPSIHMPKVACRIWLKVKSVRAERFREISDEDIACEAFGCREDFYGAIVKIGKTENPKKYLNKWCWVINFEISEKLIERGDGE